MLLIIIYDTNLYWGKKRRRMTQSVIEIIDNGLLASLHLIKKTFPSAIKVFFILLFAFSYAFIIRMFICMLNNASF